MSVPVQVFHDLSFSSQLVLWAARMWVRARTGEGHIHTLLRDSFRLAGAREAHVALDGVLTILDATSAKPIEFRRPECKKVSVDELRLLCILAVLQSDKEDGAARFLLSAWIPPAAARLAVEQGRAMADILFKAGHAIASPPGAERFPWRHPGHDGGSTARTEIL